MTLFRSPNPSRSTAAAFHPGSGGSNATAPALRTPSGTVTTTSDASMTSPPAVVTRTRGGAADGAAAAAAGCPSAPAGWSGAGAASAAASPFAAAALAATASPYWMDATGVLRRMSRPAPSPLTTWS
jgi:hypothetical protein